MTETEAADRHCSGLLNGLAAGGYHDSIAPDGTTSPYIVGTELGPEDVANGMAPAGAVEFMRRIYAVSETGAMPGTIAAAIRTALEQAETTQGGYEVYSRRVRPYSFAGVDGGRHYRQEGGDYMILVRALST